MPFVMISALVADANAVSVPWYVYTLITVVWVVRFAGVRTG